MPISPAAPIRRLIPLPPAPCKRLHPHIRMAAFLSPSSIPQERLHTARSWAILRRKLAAGARSAPHPSQLTIKGARTSRAEPDLCGRPHRELMQHSRRLQSTGRSLSQSSLRMAPRSPIPRWLGQVTPTASLSTQTTTPISREHLTAPAFPPRRVHTRPRPHRAACFSAR